MSVEEIDDSVTILESGTVKDVTKLGRIDLPILNSSPKHTHTHTHTHTHLYTSFQRNEDLLLKKSILFCNVFVNMLYLGIFFITETIRNIQLYYTLISFDILSFLRTVHRLCFRLQALARVFVVVWR